MGTLRNPIADCIGHEMLRVVLQRCSNLLFMLRCIPQQNCSSTAADILLKDASVFLLKQDFHNISKIFLKISKILIKY